MTYEIAATAGLMAPCPSYLFHGSNDGTGWLAQEKYEELSSNDLTQACLKSTHDKQVYEKMSTQPPKKKP
jgi:hypothetical protein